MKDTRFNAEYYNEYRDYLMKLGEDNSKTRARLVRNLRRAVMEELTDKQRQAIELYYVRQMKMQDIASLLGVNVSTVSRNIRRGKARLQRCLKYGARELLEDGEEE